MDDILKKTTGGLALALAVGGGGCGADPMPVEAPAPVTAEAAQVDASIQASLARLAKLELVHVGNLVTRLPREAYSCYGLCPQFAAQDAAERARQAPRLAKLVELAAANAASPEVVRRPFGEAGEALRALAALEVVQVTGMIRNEPVGPNACYGLPCPPSVVEAGRNADERRVGIVFTTAEQARESGL
jgi:hypothetical protein